MLNFYTGVRNICRVTVYICRYGFVPPCLDLCSKEYS
jgi:hypothetical protein